MKKIGVIVLLVAIGLCGCQDSSDVYFIKYGLPGGRCHQSSDTGIPVYHGY